MPTVEEAKLHSGLLLDLVETLESRLISLFRCLLMGYLIMALPSKLAQARQYFPSGYQLLQSGQCCATCSVPRMAVREATRLFASHNRHGTRGLSWSLKPSKPNAEFITIERAIACGLRIGRPFGVSERWHQISWPP